MIVLALDGRDVVAVAVDIHDAVDQLTRSSIRNQRQGTDRRLAGYLGYDWQALLEADWAAAKDKARDAGPTEGRHLYHWRQVQCVGYGNHRRAVMELGYNFEVLVDADYGMAIYENSIYPDALAAGDAAREAGRDEGGEA